jgi:hypothetical protein
VNTTRRRIFDLYLGRWQTRDLPDSVSITPEIQSRAFRATRAESDYIDGPNVYQWCRSMPIVSLDPIGANQVTDYVGARILPSQRITGYYEKEEWEEFSPAEALCTYAAAAAAEAARMFGNDFSHCMLACNVTKCVGAVRARYFLDAHEIDHPGADTPHDRDVNEIGYECGDGWSFFVDCATCCGGELLLASCRAGALQGSIGPGSGAVVPGGK